MSVLPLTFVICSPTLAEVGHTFFLSGIMFKSSFLLLYYILYYFTYISIFLYIFLLFFYFILFYFILFYYFDANVNIPALLLIVLRQQL